MKWNLRFLRDRSRKLDKRVEDAQRGAETAIWEAEFSLQRQEDIRENIVKPLNQASMHNQFAEMLRHSLVQGHGNHS